MLQLPSCFGLPLLWLVNILLILNLVGGIRTSVSLVVPCSQRLTQPGIVDGATPRDRWCWLMHGSRHNYVACRGEDLSCSSGGTRYYFLRLSKNEYKSDTEGQHCEENQVRSK